MTRLGCSVLSLDAAQILAPVTTGLLPAAAPSPAGEASVGGDFAALLESLAGVLQAARASSQGLAPTEEAPGNARTSAGTAAAPSGLGIEAGTALALELPAIPGLPAGPAPARLALGLAFSVETPAADRPEAETGSKGEAAPLPDRTAAADPSAGVLLAAPQTPVALAPAPVAQAAPAPAPQAAETATQSAASQVPASGPSPAGIPETPGASATLPGPAVAVAVATGPARPDAVPAEAAPPPGLRPSEATPGPDARLAETPVAASGSVGSPSPDPATPDFALASGLVAVTGRRVASVAPAAPRLEAAAAPASPVAARPETAVPEARNVATAIVAARQTTLPDEPVQTAQVSPPEILATLAAPTGARPAEVRRRESLISRTEPAAVPKAAAGDAPALAAIADVAATPDRITPATQQASPVDAQASRPAKDSEDLLALAEPAEPAPAPAGPALTTQPDARGPSPMAAEAPPLPPRAGAETVAALAAQMARRLDDGITRFDLELNPGDLGRVDVRLEIDAAGSVRAAFTFEHAHAANELGRRADELQKSLESAGFNLSGGLSFDVSGDRSQGRSMAWSDGREGRAQPQQPSAPEPSREVPGDIADALNGRRTAARSGVDIRI